MTWRTRKARIVAALTVPVLLAAVPIGGVAGLTLNWSASVPPGLYWTLDRDPQKGELVKVCPPDREPFRTARERGYITGGSCPGNYEPMLKRFLAAKGDRIEIGQNGVMVNGHALVNSAPRTLDGKGRALPRVSLDRVLSEREALVMTDYPDSFDGRYAGPIQRANLVSAVRPVLTW